MAELSDFIRNLLAVVGNITGFVLGLFERYPYLPFMILGFGIALLAIMWVAEG